ncbi:DNA polymerase-like protein [Tanacetum coccineum]
MAFALSYSRSDLSSLTIFLIRGRTVQDAHPPDKHIVRCDPQAQVGLAKWGFRLAFKQGGYHALSFFLEGGQSSVILRKRIFSLLLLDYMKSKAVNIWVYDRFNKKRRQVTLRIPTHERDRKKTTAAIFANSIHQKDANIAFYMINNATNEGVPIYTVHDDFITTAHFAMEVAGYYIDLFVNGPGSLEYINSFVLRNLLGCQHRIYDINKADDRFVEYFKYKPIPGSVFTDLFRHVLPHRRNDALSWKKVLELSNSYKLYISGVCGSCELYDRSSIEKYGNDSKEELCKSKKQMKRSYTTLASKSIIQTNEPRYLSEDQIASLIGGSMNSEAVVEHQEARKIDHRKRQYHKHITALNPTSKGRMPFIVADTETVLINEIHVPYAVGFLVVEPGDTLSSERSNSIETYFSEDYPVHIFETIHKRSNKMLYDFIERIAVVVRKKPSIQTVYFHNFSRFDGILLLKYFATYDDKYSFQPLLRNSRLYELVIYRGKYMLFRLRDSLMLLPGNLNHLARNLCPRLGTKGSIPHDEVQESNLIPLRDQLLEYMKQDILLLGGIMHTAQEIYYTHYKVDIVKKRTFSSLALEISRTAYYDQRNWPIHIPNRNEDTFIRRGYYGGHADSYIPSGENLYYYDVNSLYPFVMKEYPMPGGVPVWYGNLEDRDLDGMLGFIEAYVVCPKTLKKPFLPFRDKNGVLIFPTGEFVGVYYSEELKLEAKKSGNDALSYVYKILMNSLYGRFGINPKSTITEGFPEELCSPNLRSITAYARIYMYPYTSREDCYYTDTDSVVLSKPLPEEMISSSILGLFKLEDKIAQGYFLAPKTYYYKSEKGKEIIKYKGLPKNEITPEWFRLQYADPARKLQVEVEANFRIEWSKLNIFKKDILVQVGLNQGTKRIPLYRGGVWADTEPIDVKDLSRLDNISKKLMERDITENKKGMEERENIEKEMKEEPTLEGVTNPTIDEIPKTDKKKPKTGKKDKKKAKKTATTTKKKKKPP